MFETQKSVNRTSNEGIIINIRTHASPKVGHHKVSRGVSILYCVIAVSYIYVQRQDNVDAKHQIGRQIILTFKKGINNSRCNLVL